jgi:hypothetical protein
MQCIKCGADNREGRGFCAQCGGQVCALWRLQSARRVLRRLRKLASLFCRLNLSPFNSVYDEGGWAGLMGKFGTFRQFILMAAMALILAVARPAAAGDPTTILAGNHPDEAAEIAGEAAASPSQPLAMRLTMALRDRAELMRLLANQQNPASPEYDRWLTPDQFTSRFGPTDADLLRVARWLTKKGFTVKSADASTREISFTGTVAQAENAFAVKIAATADGVLYSNTTDPAVPADLAPLIESIHGLDNLLHIKPAVHRVPKRDSSAGSPDAIVNDVGPAFGPADIYTFYDETPLLNGGTDGNNSGCIAVVEDSNIDMPAADAFNTQFGLPALSAANFNIVLVDNTDPGQNTDEVETMIDVNYSHTLAPGPNIRIYLGDPNNTSPALACARTVSMPMPEDPQVRIAVLPVRSIPLMTSGACAPWPNGEAIDFWDSGISNTPRFDSVARRIDLTQSPEGLRIITSNDYFRGSTRLHE